MRGVEGEQAWLDGFQREAGDRAGEFFAEHNAVGGKAGAFELFGALGFGGGFFALAARDDAIRQIDKSDAFGEFERLFEAVGQTRLDAVAHRDAVYHHFDVVFEFFIERGGFVYFVHFAVDAQAGVARALPFGDFLFIFALATAHDRGQQTGPRALWQGHGAVDHLADGLRGDGEAGGGAVGHADARPEEPHVIIYFRHRGDG